MNVNMHFSLIVVCLELLSQISSAEPNCVCSKFAYEESLLERLIRSEINGEQREKAVAVMEKRIIRREEELTKLERELTKKLDSVSQAEEDLRQEVSKTTEQLWNMQNQTAKDMTDQLSLPLVVFHAKTVTDTTPSPGETLIFTETSLNEGGGYNTDTGVFTAPIGGVYQLSVNLCAASNKYLYFDIMAAEQIALSGVQGDKVYNTCGSFSVPVVIRAGGTAYVMCSTSSPGLNQRRLQTNTFSGVLIRKLDK